MQLRLPGWMILCAALCIALSPHVATAVQARPLLGSSNARPSTDLPVGWRGNGTGLYFGATPPTHWDVQKDGTCTGLLWRTQLPLFSGGSGAAQPIVVGERIYLCVGPKDSTRGPQDLYCLNLADGKILWVRSLTAFDGALASDRKQVEATVQPLRQELEKLNQQLADTLNAGKLDQNNWRSNLAAQRIGVGTKINDAFLALDKARYKNPDRHDWGYASATPVSDGQHIFVWYSNRLGGCYDLDGKLVWAVLSPEKERGLGEHGSHGSPVLLPDRLVTVYGTLVQAFDKTTGKLLWQQEAQDAWGLASSSLVVAHVGADAAPIILLAHGQALRADTGKPLWDKFQGYQGENTTPVVEGGLLVTYERSGIRTFKLPATIEGGKMAPAGSLVFKDIFAEYQVASPLFYDGLIYCVNDKAVLHVFDPSGQGTMVYDQPLDLKADHGWVGAPGLSPSPTLGGKYIFVQDNHGTTLVIEPGRAFKPVAKNTIATGDTFVTSPVFHGKQVLLRAQEAIYCVGEK